ncbi:MAG: hypothetical protein O2794_00085 [bacterium]|nr:hypothetical protein [bacterium]
MNRAYSIVELLIVISIGIIVTVIIVSGYSRFLDGQRLNSAVEGTISLLQKARNQTLSALKCEGSACAGVHPESGTFYGVHFDDNAASSPNRVIRFRGNDYGDGNKVFDNPGDDFVNFPKAVSLSSFSLTASTCSIGGLEDEELVFERISGDVLMICKLEGVVVATSTLTSGTITITSDSSGLSKTITILPTGVIQVQ